MKDPFSRNEHLIPRKGETYYYLGPESMTWTRGDGYKTIKVSEDKVQIFTKHSNVPTFIPLKEFKERFVEYPAGIFPPKGGWKESTWYLVEVSVKYGNPVHKSLMYSGFLDDKRNPAGYSGVTPINYAPQEKASPVGLYRYLKVLKELEL